MAATITDRPDLVAPISYNARDPLCDIVAIFHPTRRPLARSLDRRVVTLYDWARLGSN